MSPNVEIDLAALEAEISQLSPEEIADQLLKVRTKQKVQQKKYQNTPQAQAYRKKRAEQLKLMTVKLKATPATAGSGYKNRYDELTAQAEAAADAQIGKEAAEEPTSDES